MKYVTAAVATLALAFGGCAGESSRNTGSENASNDLGSAEAALTLPEGFSIDTVTYQVTGNGVNRGGDINVANSSVLRFRIGNLPVANGYTLTLGANTVGDPSYPCAGSVGFDITNTDVTALTMTLTCGGGVTYEVDPNGDLQVSVDVVQGDGTICPVATGISALPLETAVGGVIALTGYASSAATSAWTGDGTFSAASAEATDYTCVTGGIHSLTYTISKAGCDDSAISVDVECTGAGEADSGVAIDSGTVESDSGTVESDSGTVESDSGTVESDSGTVESDSGTGGGLWATCESCVTTSCAAYSGLDLATPCFNNGDTNNLVGAPIANPPAWTQACTDAVQCTVENSCGQDLASIAADCYCGTDITTCQQSGPVAGAKCTAQWAAATAPDCAADDYSCVLNNFSAATLPAGNAFFTMQCAQETCKTECAL